MCFSIQFKTLNLKPPEYISNPSKTDFSLSQFSRLPLSATEKSRHFQKEFVSFYLSHLWRCQRQMEQITLWSTSFLHWLQKESRQISLGYFQVTNLRFKFIPPLHTLYYSFSILCTLAETIFYPLLPFGNTAFLLPSLLPTATFQ